MTNTHNNKSNTDKQQQQQQTNECCCWENEATGASIANSGHSGPLLLFIVT